MCSRDEAGFAHFLLRWPLLRSPWRRPLAARVFTCLLCAGHRAGCQEPLSPSVLMSSWSGMLLDQDRDFCGTDSVCALTCSEDRACFQVLQGKHNKARNGIIGCVLARKEAVQGSPVKGHGVTLHSAACVLWVADGKFCPWRRFGVQSVSLASGLGLKWLPIWCPSVRCARASFSACRCPHCGLDLPMLLGLCFHR